jgi:tryptophanyl-tRNA synthetase
MTDQAPASFSGPRRVLSGVQPTGDLHLGNYLGALVKFARLQHEVPTLIFVADYHAITEWQDPAKLKSQVREITAA